MMPSLPSSAFMVVPTDTLSKIASTATPEIRFCSLSEMPSRSYVRRSSGSTSARLPSDFTLFGAE